MITRRAVLWAPLGLVAADALPSHATQSSPPLIGLEAALALEHEAIHSVPVVGARLPPAAKELAREIDAHHRLQRDRVAAALREAKRTPPVALPAYALPHAVVDRASAYDVLLLLEDALVRAYAAAVEIEEPLHRRLAAELMARCGTHATSLRISRDRALPGSTQAFPSRGN